MNGKLGLGFLAIIVLLSPNLEAQDPKPSSLIQGTWRTTALEDFRELAPGSPIGIVQGLDLDGFDNGVILKMFIDRFGGKEASDFEKKKIVAHFQGREVVIVGNRYWDSVGLQTVVAPWKVDVDKKPNTFELGDSKKKRLCRGILKLEDKRLTLCWTIDDSKPRPTRFESTKEGQSILMVLERMELPKGE